MCRRRRGTPDNIPDGGRWTLGHPIPRSAATPCWASLAGGRKARRCPTHRWRWGTRSPRAYGWFCAWRCTATRSCRRARRRWWSGWGRRRSPGHSRSRTGHRGPRRSATGRHMGPNHRYRSSSYIWENNIKLSKTGKFRLTFFKKKIGGHNSFCGATDAHVLDCWWFWVPKPE